MPRGETPPWRARKQPDLESHVLASVNAAEMNEQGHYGELVYTGCKTRERATEIRRALFRAAKRLNYSMHAEIENRGREFQVRYHAIDKAHARRWLVQTYGTDRSAWPYNPRSRNV